MDGQNHFDRVHAADPCVEDVPMCHDAECEQIAVRPPNELISSGLHCIADTHSLPEYGHDSPVDCCSFDEFVNAISVHSLISVPIQQSFDLEPRSAGSATFVLVIQIFVEREISVCVIPRGSDVTGYGYDCCLGEVGILVDAEDVWYVERHVAVHFA